MAPMLSTEESTKAGHQAAVKVGGVRVVRKERRSSENDNRTPSEGGSDSGKSDEIKSSENILAHTGLVAQTNKDYPEEAVKLSHTKNIPRQQPHVAQTTNVRATGPIFQPKKQ